LAACGAVNLHEKLFCINRISAIIIKAQCSHDRETDVDGRGRFHESELDGMAIDIIHEFTIEFEIWGARMTKRSAINGSCAL
jgi:hypothetical protein